MDRKSRCIKLTSASMPLHSHIDRTDLHSSFSPFIPESGIWNANCIMRSWSLNRTAKLASQCKYPFYECDVKVKIRAAFVTMSKTATKFKHANICQHFFFLHSSFRVLWWRRHRVLNLRDAIPILDFWHAHLVKSGLSFRVSHSSPIMLIPAFSASHWMQRLPPTNK